MRASESRTPFPENQTLMNQQDDDYVREDSCPGCGHPLDSQNDPINRSKASPGDMSICIYCHTLLVFNPDMKLQLGDESKLSRNDRKTLSVVRQILSRFGPPSSARISLN